MNKGSILHINCNYIFTMLHQLLIRELNKQDIKHDVFVPINKVATMRIRPDENVKIARCFNRVDRLMYHIKQIKMYKALLENFTVLDYDFVHAHTLFTDGGIALKNKKKTGIPYVVSIRNTDVNVFFKHCFWLRNYGKRILREADKIVFLSPAYKSFLFVSYLNEKERKLLESKTYVIPNGIDEFWLRNTPIHHSGDENIIRCVYAGAINKNKNVLTTIRACELLREQGLEVEFTIVGRVEDQDVLKKCLTKSFVSYISAKPKEELINIYRGSDVFVMPSLTETFGLVYAEAMSQGLPVIYSRGQGFDGQFENGEIGYAVDSCSAEEIAQRINECKRRQSELFASCIEKSRIFSWDRISRIYRDLYN